MPLKEVRGTLYYGDQPLAFGKIGEVTETTENESLSSGLYIDDLIPTDSFEFECDYEQAKHLIPQGMRNAAILKRDGFLDVTNGELD